MLKARRSEKKGREEAKRAKEGVEDRLIYLFKMRFVLPSPSSPCVVVRCVVV